MWRTAHKIGHIGSRLSGLLKVIENGAVRSGSYGMTDNAAIVYELSLDVG